MIHALVQDVLLRTCLRVEDWGCVPTSGHSAKGLRLLWGRFPPSRPSTIIRLWQLSKGLRMLRGRLHNHFQTLRQGIEAMWWSRFPTSCLWSETAFRSFFDTWTTVITTSLITDPRVWHWFTVETKIWHRQQANHFSSISIHHFWLKKKVAARHRRSLKRILIF